MSAIVAPSSGAAFRAIAFLVSARQERRYGAIPVRRFIRDCDVQSDYPVFGIRSLHSKLLAVIPNGSSRHHAQLSSQASEARVA